MSEHPELLARRFAAIEANLEAQLDARAEAIEEHASGKLSGTHDLKRSTEDLEQKHAEELQAHEAEARERRDELAKRHQKRTRKLEKAHAAQREPLEVERMNATDKAHAKLTNTREKIHLRTQPKLDKLEDTQEQVALAFRMMQEEASGLEDRIKGLALIVRGDVVSVVAADPPRKLVEVRAYLAQVRTGLDGLAWNASLLGRSQSLKVGKPTTSNVVLAIVVAIHAVVGYLLTQNPRPVEHFAYLGGSFAFSFLLTFGLTRWLRRRAVRGALDLLGGVRALQASMTAQLELQEQHYWQEYRAMLDRRHDELALVDKEFEGTRGRREEINTQLQELDRKHQELAAKWTHSDAEALETLEDRIVDARVDLEQRHEAEATALEEKYARRREEVEQRRSDALAHTEAQWKATLDELAERSAEALAEAPDQLDWAGLLTADRPWPTGFPSEVVVGRVVLPLRELDVTSDETLVIPDRELEFPLSLRFPGCGSLVVHAERAQRAKAQEILFTATMRLLATIPPGMCKLTIVDPVGLGQGLSALMELADHDEALVAGRIWTDSSHIDRRLAELTEHMEKVIQKYLRNRFESIDEYNADAGQMQEPYRFLLISDLPTGLSEMSLERLASIVSSGARCGVHVLIYHDSEQAWPRHLDASALARDGLSLTIDKAGVVRADGLARAHVAAEAPPPETAVTPLLREIGTRAIDAKRVELEFSAAAPSADEIWTRSAAKGIKVPIGRTGVTSLQEMDLGRGTAQHALIAGKTGSGKSTLFHVIITSTAMWYGPDEIQLYLIDFKKGVEFKAYATRHLPHIQVVAIESDREFGLAVLKRIDEELERRGELFRDAGVQDVPAYRKATGLPMARTMLLIDEFQEFFTEDDAIGHEASLLLDRFVRQGRAFGVHVVLGSQTLSGVYSLAKSTLGQIGVRIALQCNESDSYLILGEDNGAARLLSRPGEAIYNDMGGLVEGNNPFQVVWLSDETQGEVLEQVSARATADALERKTIVFESNAEAQPESNEPLAERLAGPPLETLPELSNVWLGEPNAIKGPTEAHFGAAGGRNLLILGQRIEAVFGMTCASIVSLAAHLPPERLRLIVFDGSGADSRYSRHLERLDEALPHAIELVPFRDVGAVVGRLDAEIKASQESGSPPERTTMLFVLGLHRFRALRQEDDFAVFGGGGGDAGAGTQFANILRDGPEQRIHGVVWVDTLSSANRALSRRTLREFDQLVLFQISAADSAELIDSRVANSLGLTNALLYVESEGRLEKFRPYTPPAAEWIDEVRDAIAARGWSPAPPEPEPVPDVPEPTAEAADAPPPPPFDLD